MSNPGDLAGLHALTGKRFWRALDDLIDQPGFRARIGAAFPALATGAGDWRRRDILKCLGGAIALAGLDGCERQPDEEAMPFVEQPEGAEPGIARFYATAVEMDGVAQPVIGKTREGRPIKLEGNGDHPASLGATNAFTQAALLDLYDPARSGAPLFQGQPTSWSRVDTALAELRSRLDGQAGAGFHLITGPVGSPTLRRQIASLLDRWPQARWHVHAPVGDPTVSNERLHLDRAHVTVSFDADLLGPGPHQIWHATQWGARRRAFQTGRGGAALFVAEPSPTMTGVTATRRLVASGTRMRALVEALATDLGVRAAPPIRLSSLERAWVGEAAAALRRNPGRGLVVAGPEQPRDVHELTRAIDRHLGNLSATRSHFAPPSGPRPQDMAALAAAIRRGEARSLFLLDINPFHSAPDLKPLLARLPLRIHAGLHVDESAATAHWHLPMPHLLESWSDGRAADGSALLVQPLVRPWLDVRSRHALLERLMGGERGDRAIVRETWPAILEDEAWTQALVSGTIPDSQPVAAAPQSARTQQAREDKAAEGLSLLVRPDPTIWDGRYASNPWLQELPKPLTKITWGNAVHISPALARERGLASGDMVRLSVGDRSVAGPVWIVPGQERRTLLVHLGHGRQRGGPVAQGTGFDAYPLVGAKGEVRIDRIDGREEVATTQHHFAMKGDEFIRFVDTLADALPPGPPRANFFSAQKSSPGWGMAIDLDLCIGCNACVVACVAENNIPMVGKEQVAKGREMHWLRVDRYYEGPPDDPRHAFQPVPCMHCEDAPCEMGCPVNAAVHSPDGLNLQVYNRCIGTRTCSAYCPYKVRRFNWFDLTAKDPPELRAARNPEVSVRGRGVMEKCTYCIQRISAARITAKKEDRPIRDGEVATACQAACPTQAIVFGDIFDGKSAVSRRKASGRDYDLLPETNTRPRTSYQARIRSGEEEA
ncbi:Fe-S-cluster-containing hydrogenase [Sphingobium estronivorans]|uniref:Fe-S-cluster-containing hydrogenase n=1 Tax=Sphingobium estronivorans TaxID=1577690 RepID=UPI00123B8F6B|nr:Fe-S-cluster-containing hydrogenase [Sphingobium estronivorans]